MLDIKYILKAKKLIFLCTSVMATALILQYIKLKVKMKYTHITFRTFGTLTATPGPFEEILLQKGANLLVDICLNQCTLNSEDKVKLIPILSNIIALCMNVIGKAALRFAFKIVLKTNFENLSEIYTIAKAGNQSAELPKYLTISLFQLNTFCK